MKLDDHAGDDESNEAEERRVREAALDETIAETFPASDPLSTDPNPVAHDAFERLLRAEADWPSRG